MPFSTKLVLAGVILYLKFENILLVKNNIETFYLKIEKFTMIRSVIKVYRGS